MTNDFLVETCMVTMRDGIKLATDVYRPVPGSEQESWPTLLVRTPYDRTAQELAGIADYFTSHEYAVVLQDVRGRYGSEGEFEPFVNEAADGHDCAVWVGEQQWCNGRIGTLGTSYLAQTQASLAVTNPPKLAAQYISQGYANYHRTRSRRGGAFETHRFEWLLRMAASSPEAMENTVVREAIVEIQNHLADWLKEGYPPRRGLTPLSALPTYEQSLFDFMTRGVLDDFWQNPGLNLYPHFDRYPDVPVTLLGSWYDGYTLETPEFYQELASRLDSPVRLVMGPWIHGLSSEDLTYAGDIDFGEAARFASLDERKRWFDHSLKDLDNGVAGEAPVRIFVMGGGSGKRLPSGRLDHGGSWRPEREWPLARATNTRLYLHAGGGLASQEPGGTKSASTYDYDPSNPVPTPTAPGTSVFEFRAGGFDQLQDPTTGAGNAALPLSARNDVLVFQTETLQDEVEVTGPINVTLFVSSSAPDTDFTVKLIDQYPASEDYPRGYALELSYTIQRARYRNGYLLEEFMVPGEIYRLHFPLPPTSNLFAKGHRIRVDVSSSNWPKYEANPNTGEPVGRHRRRHVATNTVYHNSNHASYVTLPLVPEE